MPFGFCDVRIFVVLLLIINDMKSLIFLVFLSMSAAVKAQNLALADSIVKYQMESGGWPKNQDWLRGADVAYMEECRRTGVGSTIDNGATIRELRTLAEVLAAGVEESRAVRYRAAFDRGVRYLLVMQYANGGWPQFWPSRSDDSYSNHVTFNDNAMVNVMRLLRDVADGRGVMGRIPVEETTRTACRTAFWRGVRCILDCQIPDRKGRPTVWCQQHDAHTLRPASARKYELAAYCGHGETVDIVLLLMDVVDDAPDYRSPLLKQLGISRKLLRHRIAAAVDWLKGHAIHDMKLEAFTNADGQPDHRLVHEDGAPDLWARYYDLETELPLYSDRHGLPLRSFNEIGYERRNGYSWVGYSPQRLFAKYLVWKNR